MAFSRESCLGLGLTYPTANKFEGLTVLIQILGNRSGNSSRFLSNDQIDIKVYNNEFPKTLRTATVYSITNRNLVSLPKSVYRYKRIREELLVVNKGSFSPRQTTDPK